MFFAYSNDLLVIKKVMGYASLTHPTFAGGIFRENLGVFCNKARKNPYHSEPCALPVPNPMRQISKSFLVLFFKKELLPT
jgi:hypothetical protein